MGWLVTPVTQPAGVFGAVLGVRIVFLLAGAVVLTGGALSLVLYRGVAPGREQTPSDDPMTIERAPAGRPVSRPGR